LSGPEAYDTIVVVKSIPLEWRLVKTMKFKHSNVPTLHQLVVAASVVNNNSPCYHLFDSQCYWFSNVTLQVLGRTYDVLSSKDVNPDEDDRVEVPIGVNADDFLQGIADGTLDDQREYAKGGKLSIVRIHSAKEKVIERIRAEYKTHIKLYETEMCNPYDFRHPFLINSIVAEGI
jgi:hypothetical protein